MITRWHQNESIKVNPRRQSGAKIRDAKIRAKTFPGIDEAMARQWG